MNQERAMLRSSLLNVSCTRAAKSVPAKPLASAKPRSLSTGAGARSSVVMMGFLQNLLGGASNMSDEDRKEKMDRMRRGKSTKAAPEQPPAGMEYATVAGGCFWGVELAYQRVPGVTATAVGYTQGDVEGPTYDMVCSGMTGHTEAVLVTYDPKECRYGDLLAVFDKRVDMTQVNRQGNDVGTQYRTGIYYHSEEQRKEAEAFMDEKRKKGMKIATELLPAKTFWLAESYHQQYLAKGGRFGMPQSAAKGCNDPIRCYG